MKNKNLETKRNWHFIDLEGEILGRISVQIASLLMGKAKTEYTRNLDNGDFVVAVNAKKIGLTGSKTKKKNYYHHTGYPDGMRIESFAIVQAKDPKRIISHAVKGMLPQNKLRDQFLKRLYIYEDGKHPYSDKFAKLV